MSNKPVIWQFTTKDLISGSIFLSSIISLYFGLVGEIRANKVQYEADKQVIEYRLAVLEKDNAKQVYLTPHEAILPQSPRSKRNLLISDIN